MDHEGCATLEDYLRRRTNLAQWIPRLGLGAQFENTEQILSIARAIQATQQANQVCAGERAQAEVESLRHKAQQEQLLFNSL